MKLIALVVLFSLVAPSVFGDCLIENKDLVSEVILVDSSATCADYSLFEERLIQTNELFSVKAQTTVKFQVNGNSFEPATNILKLDKTQGPPVWAHEYGHFLLFERLKVSSKSVYKIISTAFEYQLILETLKEDVRQINSTGDELIGAVNSDEPEKIVRRLERNLKTKEDLFFKHQEKQFSFWKDKNRDLYQYVFDQFISYDEFFSDLIAVVVFDNPSVISESLTSSGMSKQASFILGLRDFSINHQVENFKSLTLHGLYAPTRTYVWSDFFNKRLNTKRKSELINYIANAIFARMEDHLKNPGVEFSHEKLNRLFIKEIKRQL